ncbi:hypothetical protein CgunFtcFv8_018198 [Champsocephalus gunnari]|uniref:Uncharacterized protein n=1 Tax=Champsocephalus gunnari TaxID=52237 RepID=A0AAN8DNQ9_CHAGU|nr:hypothetical protein CgunFtcFv8_018198 [Champsocephalus gunnari]
MAPETKLHLTSHHRLPLAAARRQSWSSTNWKTPSSSPAAPPSQPSIGNFPAGVLFAGASPTKVLRVLNTWV